jgi:hypothetical protein
MFHPACHSFGGAEEITRELVRKAMRDFTLESDEMRAKLVGKESEVGLCSFQFSDGGIEGGDIGGDVCDLG